MLLVFDNCEHVVEAASSLAVTLLTECAGVRVLATGRQPLGVVGERIRRVPPLAFPEPPGASLGARCSPHDLMRYDAALLFVERASAASSSFQVTANNCRGIAQICRMLEGIPLALELAAALVRVLPVEQIAARLGNRFCLPASDSRIRPSHQQTLESMMDWSYDLLSPEERALLRRLSAFAEGWTLEAAEAVCDEKGENTLLSLMTLVDKSLVNYEERYGEPRYWMLETTRQYARGKLTTTEWAEAANRHADFYTHLVTEAAKNPLHTTYREIYSLLEREHHNILAALDWTACEKSAQEELHLATSLCRFWYQRGYLLEGRRRIQHALDRLKEAPDALRAEALNGVGSIAFSQGDYTAALGFHSESLELYRRLGNRYAVAVVLADVGLAAQQQKAFSFTRSRYTESLALMTQIENLWGIGYGHSLLGTLAFDEEDYEGAEALFQKSLPQLMQANDASNVAICLAYLGKIHRRRDEFIEALPPLLSSFTMRAEQGDIVEIACSVQDFAYLAWARNDACEAARLGGAAEELRDLCGLPILANEQSEYDAMVTHLQTTMGVEQFTSEWNEGRSLPLDKIIGVVQAYASSQDCCS